MADWILQHREISLGLLAALVIIVPIGIGTAMGHIPKQMFRGWALSLSAATFLLAMGILFIEHRFSPLYRLIISFCFGLIWIVAGFYLRTLERKAPQSLPGETSKLRQMISKLFLGFGILWIAISFYQFWSV